MKNIKIEKEIINKINNRIQELLKTEYIYNKCKSLHEEGCTEEQIKEFVQKVAIATLYTKK